MKIKIGNFDCSNISHNMKAGDNVPATEATNIIIKLTEEGWDAEKINSFIVFIETHRPSEDEAMGILKKQKINMIKRVFLIVRIKQ